LNAFDQPSQLRAKFFACEGLLETDHVVARRADAQLGKLLGLFLAGLVRRRPRIAIVLGGQRRDAEPRELDALVFQTILLGSLLFLPGDFRKPRLFSLGLFSSR